MLQLVVGQKRKNPGFLGNREYRKRKFERGGKGRDYVQFGMQFRVLRRHLCGEILQKLKIKV